MVVLAEIGQVLIAGLISGAVAYWIGPAAYGLVAVLVLLTCSLLLLDAERRTRQGFHQLEAMELLTLGAAMVGTALVFALIWPALPLMLFVTALRRRGENGP